MSKDPAPKCPLCLTNDAQATSAANPYGLCPTCKVAWDRAFADDATVGSLIDLVRTSGGRFDIDGTNYASPASQSPADFANARKAVDDALDASNCVGQGRLGLLKDIQDQLKSEGVGSFAWFVLNNANPLVLKTWPELSIRIENCTAEVSVNPKSSR
jgi:hypothetical protein